MSLFPVLPNQQIFDYRNINCNNKYTGDTLYFLRRRKDAAAAATAAAAAAAAAADAADADAAGRESSFVVDFC